MTIQVIEGSVEDIKISGTKRLNQSYVRSRLRLGTSTPLNKEKLLNALKLLQINPLIDSISAELRAGLEPGTNVLEVDVKEAQTWSSQVAFNQPWGVEFPCFYKQCVLRRGKIPVAKRNSTF